MTDTGQVTDGQCCGKSAAAECACAAWRLARRVPLRTHRYSVRARRHRPATRQHGCCGRGGALAAGEPQRGRVALRALSCARLRQALAATHSCSACGQSPAGVGTASRACGYYSYPRSLERWLLTGSSAGAEHGMTTVLAPSEALAADCMAAALGSRRHASGLHSERADTTRTLARWSAGCWHAAALARRILMDAPSWRWQQQDMLQRWAVAGRRRDCIASVWLLLVPSLAGALAADGQQRWRGARG